MLTYVAVATCKLLFQNKTRFPLVVQLQKQWPWRTKI